MTTGRSLPFIFLAVLTFAAAGCTGVRAADATTTSAGQVAAPKTTRIVFVGKERPCDCTRKSIDAAWAVLQMVLGTPAKVPVEELKVDTQADKVEPYRKQRPIMTLPAVYFLDAGGNIVDMLQGSLSVERVTALLN